MDDDLNMNEALAAIFELARQTNVWLAADQLSSTDAAAIRAQFLDFDRVLGVLELSEKQREKNSASIPPGMVPPRVIMTIALNSRLTCGMSLSISWSTSSQDRKIRRGWFGCMNILWA